MENSRLRGVMEVHKFHTNAIGIEEIVLPFAVQAHLRVVVHRYTNHEVACFNQAATFLELG
jgi:hypothetical protein